MPLATLLDRLGGLLSKYFIVGQFFPALIFGFLNAAILYGYSPWFRDWSGKLTSPSPSIFFSVVVLIAVAVTGYLLSCVSSFLREVLEGKHFPEALEGWRQQLVAAQTARYQDIHNAYYNARVEGARIEDARPEWKRQLTAAAVVGVRTQVNNYTITDDAAQEIMKLRGMRQRADAIPIVTIQNAVSLLVVALKANNLKLPETGPKLLAEDRLELLILIDYARDTWAAQELQKFNETTRFGIGIIEPTAMGNIAASMQGYGITRYKLNLETLWPRLQPILAGANKDFYQGMLDSRTQLDFLVCSCWLSALTTAAWMPILALMNGPWWLFAAVALAGPAGMWLSYRLAVENYVVFTALVRASVDLYRFQLLQQLHIALPGGIRDERVLWEALQRLSTYGQEAVDLSYQHDQKGVTN